MNWEQAFKKSALAYFEGKSPDNYKKASGKKQKYNHKYFNRVSKEKEIDEVNLSEDYEGDD